MFSMAKVNVGTGEDHYVIEVEAAELNSTQPQAVGSEEEENGDESNTGQASKARYLLLVTQKKVNRYFRSLSRLQCTTVRIHSQVSQLFCEPSVLGNLTKRIHNKILD